MKTFLFETQPPPSNKNCSMIIHGSRDRTIFRQLLLKIVHVISSSRIKRNGGNVSSQFNLITPLVEKVPIVRPEESTIVIDLHLETVNLNLSIRSDLTKTSNYVSINDGSRLHLERWIIRLDSNAAKKGDSSRCSYYNEYCIFLRTIANLTRLLPVFQLKRQLSFRGAKDSLLLSVFETKKANLTSLKDLQGDFDISYTVHKLGALSTPFGDINLTVCYQRNIEFKFQGKREGLPIPKLIIQIA